MMAIFSRLSFKAPRNWATISAAKPRSASSVTVAPDGRVIENDTDFTMYLLDSVGVAVVRNRVKRRLRHAVQEAYAKALGRGLEESLAGVTFLALASGAPVVPSTTRTCCASWRAAAPGTRWPSVTGVTAASTEPCHTLQESPSWGIRTIRASWQPFGREDANHGTGPPDD